MPALVKKKSVGVEQWNTPRQIALHILQSKRMDVAVGLLVSAYLVVVIIETDHNAKEVSVPDWIKVANPVVLILFTMELLARIFVFRCSFFGEFWNCMDFILISVDCTSSIIGFFVGESFGVSAIRIFRLSRLARVKKIVQLLPELHVMVAGLIPALHSIFWGSLLLLVTLILWSIMAVHFINPLNKEVADPSCDRCARAFESVFQSTLTFTQQIVCGDSWGQVTIPIIEAYPFTAVYFMAVFASVALAVLNLILGVIVNVATEASDTMRKDMEIERWMESQAESLAILADMDDDGSGELTKQELITGYENNEPFRNFLAGMGIEQEDIGMVWDHLDSDGSGTLTAKEFSTHLCDMNAANTEFMLMHIKAFVLRMNSSLVKMREDLTAEFGHLKSGLYTDLHKEFGILREEHRTASALRPAPERQSSRRRDDTKADANPPQMRSDTDTNGTNAFRAEDKLQERQLLKTGKSLVPADMLSQLQGLLQESEKTLQDIRNCSATIWL